jgi:hypothetical protein
VEFPLLTHRTFLHHTAQRRCAAVQDRTHRFGLFIGKTMNAFIFSDMFSENLCDLRTRSLRIYTVRIWRELYFGSCSFASIVLTTV